MFYFRCLLLKSSTFPLINKLNLLANAFAVRLPNLRSFIILCKIAIILSLIQA